MVSFNPDSAFTAGSVSRGSRSCAIRAPAGFVVIRDALVTVSLVTAVLAGFVVSPAAARAGPTWIGTGANASWGTAANWNEAELPDLADGTSDIVFATMGSGTAAVATQLGGGLIDILSLRSNVTASTGTTVSLGSTGVTVTGMSINSGTLVVRSGSITKANQAALVINSTLRLESDGFFSSQNSSNTGLIIPGPIVEDGVSRNVVINTTAGSVALGGTSTYTGSTTVERGTLLVGLQTSGAANAGVSAAPGVAGALGNSTSEVLVGNATTAANDWDVTLDIGSAASMSRSIRFADAGSGVATLTTRGGAGLLSGTVALDRVINWNAITANHSWTGRVTGTGGIIKTGANELRLTNTANDFTGPVSVLVGDLQFEIAGTTNALGTGASVIQATAAGVTASRSITAYGSGTFARGFDVVATAAHTVTIRSGNAGDVTFAGPVTLNSLGATVALNAANSGTVRYTGVISGSAPVVTFGGASSNGNRIVLENTANSFTGQIRIFTAGLFVGNDAPAGAPGPLGNATSAIIVGAQTAGGNPSSFVTDGPYTVGRDIIIAGPGDGAADAFTGRVFIGGVTTDASVFSGNLAVNRTNGIGQNVLLAATGGSVEFSGAISGTSAIRIGGGSGQPAGFPGSSSAAGDVILSGNNSGFSGDIALTTGARLVVASNTALGTGTGTIALYDNTQVTTGTGGISTRGAVTVGRNFLLDGVNVQNANRPVSFEGTTADASAFTGSITINARSGQSTVFAAAAGGTANFQGVITITSTSGTANMAVIKNGDGLVIFSATNNYQGPTTVNAGVLRGTDGVGISGSNVLLAGGVWESAADITRSLGTGVGQVRLGAGSSGTSGFSSANAAGITVAIGGTAAPTALTFGASNFTMDTLALNATTATGPVLFLNPLNLGSGTARGISVGGDTATVSAAVSGTAGGAFFKDGAGTLVLSASNSFNSTTTVAAGVLRLTNEFALQNSPLDTSGAGSVELTVTTPTFGGLVGAADLSAVITAGYGGVTALTLNSGSGSTQTYTGAVTDGAVGMTVTKTGSGTQILGGANSYTGQTTVSAGTLHLGVGSGLTGDIVNAASLVLLQGGSATGVLSSTISGTGRVAVGGGTVVLANTANPYTGRTAIDAGVAEVAVLANAGVASPLGAATGSDARIDLGSGTSAGTLRYVGSGHSTDRPLYLAGDTGGGVLDASGSGTVAFTGGVTAAAGAKTLTLTGTSTADNVIGQIGSTVVDVNKTGSGLWVSGTNSFTGRLRVLEGTLVANADASYDGSGVFGDKSNGNPIVGASGAGTARLVLDAGFTIARTIEVAEAGGGSQTVILGGRGAGISTYSNEGSSAIWLGRDVTLEAGPGNETQFFNAWKNGTGGGTSTASFTVGTPDNTGTVLLGSAVPDDTEAVDVRYGTLRLGLGGGNTLAAATRVTIANAGILDLNDRVQDLTNLALTGTAARVVAGGTGGILQMLTGGTLAGSGTIGSFTSIAGIHSPGQSPGLQTFESGLTYAASSTLVWELSANTNLTGNRGVLYDGIDLTGGALSIESGATLSLVFNAPLFDATPSTVNFYDSFWGQDRSWTVIALSGSATWDDSLFTIDAIGTDANNVSLVTARPGGQFFLSQTDGNLVLNYSVVIVPEPGGLALALLGLAALGYSRCRRPRTPAMAAGRRGERP